MTQRLQLLFSLLRAGLYGTAPVLAREIPEKIWNRAFLTAARHGVAAIAGEGLSLLPEEQRPPKEIVRKWVAQVIAQRNKYAKQRFLVKELREVWEKAGITCIELKGDSIGQYYHTPEVRFSCDFDCILSDYEAGNKVIESLGIEVNRGFYKNSSFNWKNLFVENHQFCTPVRGNSEMKRLERKLRELLNGCTDTPSENFNALFLMEHAWAHFFENALTLKQLCDWAVFRRTCDKEVDWTLFEEEARACGFWHFSESMNRLADLLDGVISDEQLGADDKRLAKEIFRKRKTSMNDGWNTRFFLFKNYFSSSWKYLLFSNHSMLYSLCRTTIGFLFDRKPEIR